MELLRKNRLGSTFVEMSLGVPGLARVPSISDRFSATMKMMRVG